MRCILSVLFYLTVSTVTYGQESIRISVDFGGANSSFPWNNIENSQSGSIVDLINQFGQTTGIGISVNDAFNGTNSDGTQTPDPALGFPETATGDSFFGNAVEFDNKIEETGGVNFFGLDANEAYELEIFSSREATDNRETTYIIEGLSSEFYQLNVSSNSSESITISDLFSEPDGSLSITATTGPNNDNSFGFFYLVALKLRYEDGLVQLDSLLVLDHPSGGEYWQAGKSPEIRWTSQNIEQLLLEYSTDNGSSWMLIAEVSAFPQPYEWEVPDFNTQECLIRITSGHLQDQSSGSFTITNTDISTCHIIVLGSSTAAGTGPTSVDSAWVWRYDDFIFQNDTRFEVTNLARGGFTTYNILPSDAVVPVGLPFVIDAERNITKALSLEPDAIIINLPSNDAANSIPVIDQIQNYQHILVDLEVREIPYWICTPQPRNSFNTTQQMIQDEILDSTRTFFADNNIDFWTGLATGEGSIDLLFDSGDGIHLNSAGHRILLQRVLASGIESSLLDTKIPPRITYPSCQYSNQGKFSFDLAKNRYC